MLQPTILQSALRLQKRIEHILSQSSDPALQCLRTPGPTPSDPSAPKEERSCLVLSPLDFWRLDASLVAADTTPETTLARAAGRWSDHNAVVASGTTGQGLPLSVFTTLGGRFGLPPQNKPSSSNGGASDTAADFLILTFFFRTPPTQDDKTINTHQKFLQLLHNVTGGQVRFLTPPKASSIERLLSYSPPLSHDPPPSFPWADVGEEADEFNGLRRWTSTSFGVCIGLVLVYAGLIGLILRRFGQLARVHSRWGLALTSLISVLVVLIVTTSVCALAGVPLPPPAWPAIPLGVLLVGAENLFLLLDALVNTPIHWPVQRRVAHGLAQIGPPMAVTILMDVLLASCIALLVQFPAVQQWAVLSMAVYISDFFMQCVFIATVVSIDMQRLDLADMLTQGGKLDDPPLAHSSSTSGLSATGARRRNKSDAGGRFSTHDNLASSSGTSRSSATALGRGLSFGPKGQHVYAVAKARAASLAFFLMVILYLISASPDLPDHNPASFPLLSQQQPDVQEGHDFISSILPPHHPPQAVPDHSPSGSLWRALNPSGAPQVPIMIEPWSVLSLRSRRSPSGSSQRRTPPRAARARPKSRTRKGVWLAKHVVVPMAATIGALWLLLLYLLKDTELLDAQRDRLPGTEASSALVVGSDRSSTPTREEASGSSTGASTRLGFGSGLVTRLGSSKDGNGLEGAQGAMTRATQDGVAGSLAWMTSATLDARVLPNATPADIVMLAEAAGFVAVLDILGNVSMAPSVYPTESELDTDPIGTNADIGMWRKLSAQVGARIKEDGDSVTAMSVDAERQFVLLGTRYGVLHVVSISACASLPPRVGIHGKPGGSPAIVYLGTVRKRFFQTIGKAPVSRTHIHASANVVVFADGAIYETTLDKQPRLIRSPEPLDRWTAFNIPLAALPGATRGTPTVAGDEGDVHLLGLASSHARVSIWLHEARLNRWTELAKLQLNVGHIVRTTALIARGPKDSLPGTPEGIDFVGGARPPPDASGPKSADVTTTGTGDTPPPSVSSQLTDSSLALLGTNTGRVLVYDLRNRQMVQVLEIGDGPVQRIMVPPTSALQSSSPSPPWVPSNPSTTPPFVLAGLLTKSHVWLAKVYPDLVDAARVAVPHLGTGMASASSTSLNTSAPDLVNDERSVVGSTCSNPSGSLFKAAHLAHLFGPANAKYGTHTGFVREPRRGGEATEELSGPTNWADSGAMSGPGDGPNQITTPDGQTITLRAPSALTASNVSEPNAGTGNTGAQSSSDAGSTGYPISMHGARSRRANSTRALRAHSTSILPSSNAGSTAPSTLPSSHMANVGMELGLSLEGAPDKGTNRADDSTDDTGSCTLGATGDNPPPPECTDLTDSPPSTPRRDVREEPVRMAGSTGCVRGAADGVGRFVVGVRRQTTHQQPLTDPPHPGARWQVFAVDLLADTVVDGSWAAQHQRAAAAQAIALGSVNGSDDEDRLAFGSVRTVGADACNSHLVFCYGNSVAAIHVPSA